jgi:putative ABC transport system permease protein
MSAWFAGVGQDLRQAVRAMWATPVVSVAAVLSLALGIGANTAIFSLVDSLLFRKLPVAEPERLVTVTSEFALGRGFSAGAGWNYPMWQRLEARSDLFGGAFAWASRELTLERPGVPAAVNAMYASGGFFSTLGIAALRGRMFTGADDVLGGGPQGPVAVISYGLWQRRFGGSEAAVGTAITIEGVEFTVAGVAPRDFIGLEVGQAVDVILPLRTEPLIRGSRTTLLQPRAYLLLVMLRLKPSQDLRSAISTLRGLEPEIVPANAPQFIRPFALAPAAEGTSNGGGLRQRFQRPLVIILVVSALVLVIACLNIANLLLARAVARQHEFGLRVAVGATRPRLARQLLIESFVLAAAGAIAGLAFAIWGSRMLVAQLSTTINRVVLALSLEWHVLAFTTVTTAIVALIFGLVPAGYALRTNPMDTLRSGRDASRGSSARAAGAVVIVQVALSLMLVLVAALLIGTFVRLATVPVGFDTERVLVVRLDTLRTGLDSARRPLYIEQALDDIRGLPGVEGAAASMWTPLSGGGPMFSVAVAGAPPDAERTVVGNFVTPGWFAAYGTALRMGRDFHRGDTEASAPVVIVNEAFVRRFNLEGRAVGTTIVSAAPRGTRQRTIVGVVGNAVFRSGRMIPAVASLALREEIPPMIYLPLAQSVGMEPPDATVTALSLRSASGRSAASLVPDVAARLAAIDPRLTFTFRPLSDYVDAAIAQERTIALLATFFGALGLLLAGVGIYGVVAYSVSLRRREIGVRLALGAAPPEVVGLVFRRVTFLIGTGIAGGALAARWGTRALDTLVYGVDPRDPVTLLAAAAALGLVGVLAGAVPALSASRTDPAIVLRSE